MPRAAGRYVFAGLTIESDVHLFDEALDAGAGCDCRIEPLPDEVALPPLEASGVPGLWDIETYRHGDGFVLRCWKDALFEISAAGDRIRHRFAAGLPHET